MKVVVLISADGEWKAVKSVLGGFATEETSLGEIIEARLSGMPMTVLHGGWGRTAAAASTQYAIDRWQPDLLVNLGTCGGFDGRIERGTIVLVDRAVIYDIVEQMTDPDEAIQHYTTELDLRWLPEVPPTPVRRGLLVSGDRDIVPEDIPGLVQKFGAVAADWETGAIAWVAGHNKTRLLVLRGVSDLVGSAGGEAYGDYQLFEARTKDIMTHLFEVLPDWLKAIDKMQRTAPS